MGTVFEKAVKNKNNEKAVLSKPETQRPVETDVFAQRVEKKAYELYEKRGCQDGYNCDDWLEAERIVEQEMISGK